MQRRSGRWGVFDSRRKRGHERAILSNSICFLRHTPEADYGVCDVDPKVSRPGIPSFLVYTSTGRALGNFGHIFHVDLGRVNCLIWRRTRWNLRGRGAQDLRTRGEDDFSNYSTANTNYSINSTGSTMTWLSSSASGVSFRVLSGEHGARKNGLKRPCEGLILANPRFEQH